MATTLTTPSAAVGPRPGRGSASVRMLGNETGKGLRVMWVHKAPLVLELVMLSTMYWGVQLFIGGGRYVNELLAMTFAGYLAYIVSYIALLRMASGLLEEMFTGTLEQSMLSPLQPWVQATGRLVAALAEALAIATIAGAAYLVIFAGMGVELTFGWSELIPVVLAVADIAGFAMLIGGIALIVNSIGSIVHVIQSFIMFLNGALIPIFAFPAGLEIAAKFVPTTLAVDAIRRLTTAGETLDDVWASGTLPWALAHAVVMLILGWTVYQTAIRRGLREGRLGA